ncbi:MAG: glycosyltransferase family 2 protein [Opitutaceae bacterium]
MPTRFLLGAIMTDAGTNALNLAGGAPEVSLVIPCYNEETVLDVLFERVTAAAAAWDCTWEIVCVDDGSQDRTWAMLQAQHVKDPRWKSLSFARNFGQQTAISAGLFHAAGRAVMIIDADLQDPPELLKGFIEKWREGYEVVYAVRIRRKGGIAKRVAYWAFYRLLAKTSSLPIPRDSGDFCLMDRCVVDVLNSMPERHRFLRGLRVWPGFRQIGIAYRRPLRAAGETKYTFRKLFNLAFDGIFAFSDVPLRVAVFLGLAVSGVSAFLLGLVFLHRLWPGIPDWIGLAHVSSAVMQTTAIVFFGGVQLFCTGLLGEYMGRVYDEVKRRPQWVVRQAAGVQSRVPPR